jgi:hypothetical protein
VRVLKYSLIESDANSDFCVNAVWTASVSIGISVIDTGHFGLYDVLVLINIHEVRAEIMRRINCGNSRLFSSKIVIVICT